MIVMLIWWWRRRSTSARVLKVGYYSVIVVVVIMVTTTWKIFTIESMSIESPNGIGFVFKCIESFITWIDFTWWQLDIGSIHRLGFIRTLEWRSNDAIQLESSNTWIDFITKQCNWKWIYWEMDSTHSKAISISTQIEEIQWDHIIIVITSYTQSLFQSIVQSIHSIVSQSVQSLSSTHSIHRSIQSIW